MMNFPNHSSSSFKLNLLPASDLLSTEYLMKLDQLLSALTTLALPITINKARALVNATLNRLGFLRKPNWYVLSTYSNLWELFDPTVYIIMMSFSFPWICSTDPTSSHFFSLLSIGCNNSDMLGGDLHSIHTASYQFGQISYDFFDFLDIEEVW
ncbi:hypothetical protein JTB14_027344 [Gonioctena quinquepunctata]|nr:hypothetical protein JTB14_027344 [Gonioctena quinquepunctata]